MIAVPAFVWRGGYLLRALIIGGVVGLCIGGLAWIDSGALLVGIIVAVAVGGFFGVRMPGQMNRYWPGSQGLSGDVQARVVRTVRRGEPTTDARLAQPVLDYNRALHASAEKMRTWRWLLVIVLVVAVAIAVWDGIFGSWGNVVASAIYLVALLLELFWLPTWRGALLANADRAAQSAGLVLESEADGARD